MWLFYVIIVLGLALDRITKILAKTYLINADLPIIQNIFHLAYVENRGAAFGIMQGSRYLFIILTAVTIAFFIVYIYNRKNRNLYTIISVGMIVAGGLGNLIDRVANGYVVDFLYAKFIDFPVFNVADSLVVVGISMFMIYYIFDFDKKKMKP